MEDLFLKEKPVKALVSIMRAQDEIYCGKVSKEIDTTYAHTVKIIARMEDEDLVWSEKKGRKKILHLTPYGKKIAKRFIDLFQTFENKEATKEQF